VTLDNASVLKLSQQLFLVFTSILFIVDPFAAVPSFLAMTARDTPDVRRRMARRGAWTAALTLTAFALGGTLIFRLFGITLGAFKIAGGILLGLSALDMVQARRSEQKETPVEQAEGLQKEDVGGAIALTAWVSYVTLAAASVVERRLGQTGMRILTRLMGLVLCAIAVQFIVDGIKMTGLVRSP
jgi:multiple antibiotic resistance protein